MTSLWGNPSQINASASGTLLGETLVNTSPGQTVFTITKFTYTPGTQSLLVFINGQLQALGADYAETNSSSITFTTGLNVTDIVYVIGFPLASISLVPPASSISATDGSAGSLWTTVQGFINKIISSAGSAFVGYDTGTVQNILDEAKPLSNYAALRSYTGRATGVRITGVAGTAQPQGIAGNFEYDSTDTTSGAVFTGSVAPVTGPAAPTLGSAAGGALAATTYFVKVALITAAGESLPSAESSLAVLANNLLDLS